MSDSNKNALVMIVDDEADFREAMAYSLKRFGYKVITADNGRAAFELLRQNPVKAIVSDIRMPGGDGIELLERTRAEHFDTPIILLMTGFADLSTEDAHHKGAEALFSKPFEGKTLHAAIERLLTPPDQRWSQPPGQVDTDLKINVRFAGMSEALEAKVMNLGRGGMFVALDQRRYPNVNDSVDFKLFFESAGTLVGSGIVRWVRTQETTPFPAGCGIEFTYLTDHDRQTVIDFLDSKKTAAFIPNR